MNNALQSSISSNPGLKGILYADSNGLCVAGIFDLFYLKLISFYYFYFFYF